MKKVLCLALGLAMSLSLLAACSGGSVVYAVTVRSGFPGVRSA